MNNAIILAFREVKGSKKNPIAVAKLKMELLIKTACVDTILDRAPWNCSNFRPSITLVCSVTRTAEEVADGQKNDRG